MTAENAPGQPTIAYRSGTHGHFMASMLARLSSLTELAALKTRTPADPSIALLDAWATIADVLTFYTERIANEGFARTATEWRSLVELARLVGHTPKPGAAADAYLAYTVDPDIDRERIAIIPRGSRANSVPGPGEMPHPFETSANLWARDSWNELKPRLTQPTLITYESVDDLEKLYFKGIGLNIRRDDRLLFDFGEKQKVLRVISVRQDLPKLQTVVRFKVPFNAFTGAILQAVSTFTSLYAMSPALAPKMASQAYAISMSSMFAVGQDTGSKIVASHSGFGNTLYQAMAGLRYEPAGSLQSVQILRVKAARKELSAEGDVTRLVLDAVYDGIREGTLACIEYVTDGSIESDIETIDSANAEKLDDYVGSPTQSRYTVLKFNPKLSVTSHDTVRAVYGAGEELELAEEPVTAAVGGAMIDLDGFFDGFDPGRLFIVTGERTDIPGTAGVAGAELVTLASCEHLADPNLSGDTVHTVLHLAASLGYTFKRDTVKIFGNVVAATAGESRTEVLVAANTTSGNSRFPLHGAPLTWTNSAEEPSGVAPAIEVRVDGAPWTRYSRLGDIGPNDHGYVLRTDAEGRSMVVLGGTAASGVTRPGQVVATYRTSLGQAGNVRANQITQLGSRPLGVRQVTNPLPAAGGADPDPSEPLRRNISLPTRALDRPVSLPDYADLALTRPGVGRAEAARLSEGGTRFIHVTVAGPDGDAPSVDSPVLSGLAAAYRRFGDPDLLVRVQGCDVVVVVMSAGIKLVPGQSWLTVEAAVRDVLLDRFGLQARPLGAALSLGEVTAAIQDTAGVDYVDIDVFAGVAAQLGAQSMESAVGMLSLPPQERIMARTARREGESVKPAELTGFSSRVPETLVLKEIA